MFAAKVHNVSFTPGSCRIDKALCNVPPRQIAWGPPRDLVRDRGEENRLSPARNTAYAYIWPSPDVPITASQDRSHRNHDVLPELSTLTIWEWRKILESLCYGVYVTDQNGITLYVNPAWEKITGLPGSVVLGREVQELSKEGYFFPICTPQVLAKKEVVTVLQRVKSGRYVVCTGNPVFDEAGNVQKVVTVVRDIRDISDELTAPQLGLVSTPRKEGKSFDREPSLIAQSSAMKKILELAEIVAQTDATVLITGESGVGKGLIASYIHKRSCRKTQSFLPINCAAVPESLLESELFGYESGAFTGASKGGKTGLFELANKGTVFLDEVAEMPLSMQAKLLRFLDSKEFIKVGGNSICRADVRIIAATNKDLAAACRKGEFRTDLYWRLSTIVIDVPPLRDRKEDIEPLTEFFLEEICAKYKVRKRISAEVLRTFTKYDWPGNIRQLRNVIERAVIISKSLEIGLDDIPEEVRSYSASSFQGSPGGKLREILSRVEREVYLTAYRKHKSTYKVAKELGVSQSTAARKLRRYLL